MSTYQNSKPKLISDSPLVETVTRELVESISSQNEDTEYKARTNQIVATAIDKRVQQETGILKIENDKDAQKFFTAVAREYGFATNDPRLGARYWTRKNKKVRDRSNPEEYQGDWDFLKIVTKKELQNQKL